MGQYQCVCVCVCVCVRVCVRVCACVRHSEHRFPGTFLQILLKEGCHKPVLGVCVCVCVLSYVVINLF